MLSRMLFNSWLYLHKFYKFWNLVTYVDRSVGGKFYVNGYDNKDNVKLFMMLLFFSYG